ncbi:hypothetical protein D2V17_15205 [Aurantiacibacter xanthus]|uniref:Uncharacterized protein n=1 Tax=Aurantiacibacter xanthus TaxID=1784712 RepID=A0A3A1P304_9SPHN|nr:hypothetical protein [Aurantiacibacter xanthus]RIV82658.1 hypothetical protein D2V17_15205 [Aurantiacibacter xanthus]
MTPFRWQNCYADVAAAKHDLTIRSFLDDVILPAIHQVEARITELGHSDEPAACFEQSDMEEVLAETKLAFCLAIQSIWERQLRAYLYGCAEALRPGEGVGAKVERANWPGMCALFRELRGIRIEAFPSFGELDTLHHLGNACRHGDGVSAAELTQRCPDWWPVYTSLPPEFGPSSPPRQTVAAMSVPVERIETFVGAIVGFWEDAAYIYRESIADKHESLERRLVRERIERAWRPTAEEHRA